MGEESNMDKTATGWGKKSAGAPGWKRSSGRKR